MRNNLPDGPSFTDIDAKLNSFQVRASKKDKGKSGEKITPIDHKSELSSENLQVRCPGQGYSVSGLFYAVSHVQ